MLKYMEFLESLGVSKSGLPEGIAHVSRLGKPGYFKKTQGLKKQD